MKILMLDTKRVIDVDDVEAVRRIEARVAVEAVEQFCQRLGIEMVEATVDESITNPQQVLDRILNNRPESAMLERPASNAMAPQPRPRPTPREKRKRKR